MFKGYNEGEMVRMLKLRNIVLVFVLALLTLSGVLAQDATEEPTEEMMATEEMAAPDEAAAASGTIADIVAGDPQFSTLLSLVEAAGLTDVLADPNAQYTVYAPTNDAFAVVPQVVLDYLAANPELLTRVLTYHVVEGATMSADITESMMAPSMEMGAVGGEMMGSELTVTVTSSGIKVDAANVVGPDIAATNGVVHAIDSVLVPAVAELPAVDPLAVSGDIITAGSSTVFPLTQRMADEFQAAGFSGNVTVDSVGTGAGGERFCVNVETDLWNASRPAKDEEITACESNGREVVEFVVATDALAVVVSAENDFVESLSFEQLAQIFSGEAATWADVDPSFPAEAIQLYSPGSDSGTYDYFVEAVFDGDEEPIQSSGANFSEDDNVLVTGVEGSPYAIGYFGFAYFQENQGGLRAVGIEGVEPNEETGATGEYPLSRPLFIYTAPSVLAEKPQVAEFINYYLQNANAQLGGGADQIGYIPVEQYVTNRNALFLQAATATAAMAQ
jgi:phosphate transport system substrate-binding protein